MILEESAHGTSVEGWQPSEYMDVMQKGHEATT